MGPVRFYILAATTLLLILAVFGVVHLVSSRAAPGAKQSDLTATLSAPKDAVIAITEIGSTETKGRNGQMNVAVKIGVAPRPQTRKGEVEIRVSFFDVTPNGEMRPTDADVNYEWLTPVRDWTDPTPKYLVATYLGAGTVRRSMEKLRYGGFVARVYFDGRLQAERSEPKGLVTALRNAAAPSVSPAAALQSQASITVASPSPVHANREDSSAVPYASPVPDKPGFVYSPHNPKFLIDVRGFPPGTEVNDPNTGKPFKVP
ncbi:MAG: hypothetical protein V7609_701 [Verrucomicrobiota bacterium]